MLHCHFNYNFWTFIYSQLFQDKYVTHLFFTIPFADCCLCFKTIQPFHIFCAGFTKRRIHQCPPVGVTEQIFHIHLQSFLDP